MKKRLKTKTISQKIVRYKMVEKQLYKILFWASSHVT